MFYNNRTDYMNSYQKANLAAQIVSSLLMTKHKAPSESETEFRLTLVREAFHYIECIDKVNSEKPTYYDTSS
jgi:hypothetical protein